MSFAEASELNPDSPESMSMKKPEAPIRYVVVMGVAGCGKSTVAKLAADRLGWRFVEGDSLHPPTNVEKMSQGIPLNDDDRLPWLQTVADMIQHWRDEGQSGVIACSALRRSYRDIIAAGANDVCFAHLHGERTLIAQRLAERRGHFMPLALLDSQFATLEVPSYGERAINLDILASPDSLAEKVVQAVVTAARH